MDFFDACKQHRSQIKKSLNLPFAETIDRWVRTRKINNMYKTLVIRFFKRNGIEVN